VAGVWRPEPSGKDGSLPTPHGVSSHGGGASRPSASRRETDRDTGRGERAEGSRGAAVGSRPGSRALLSQGGQEGRKDSHGHGGEGKRSLGLSRDPGHHLADLSLAALPQGGRRQATAATGNSSARRTAQGVLTNSEYLAHKSRQIGGPTGSSGGPRVTSLKPMPLPRKPTSRERGHRGERDFLAPRRESGLSSGLSTSQSRRP